MILIAESISHFVNGNVNMAKIMKRAQTGKNVPKGMVESEMFPGKMIPKSKSNYATGNYAKMLGSKPKDKVAPKKGPILDDKIYKKSENPYKTDKNGKVIMQKFGGKTKMKAGGMLKRADGSYSKRGLWDNIRANKGSGKKPTAAMLKQERKIKSKTK
jgi:hypothetical protein